MTGHVIVTMLRSLISIAAIIAVAFGLGFRPSAGFGDWLAVAGIVMAACFATSWLTVALGLAAKTPQSAATATVPLVMLPFFSSAIVPAAASAHFYIDGHEYRFTIIRGSTPLVHALPGGFECLRHCSAKCYATRARAGRRIPKQALASGAERDDFRGGRFS
jgi:hypothetical protein